MVVAAPFVARLVDDSADEFSIDRWPVLPSVGWLVCALLAAVVVTHRAQISLTVDEGSAVAVAYDLLPLLLFAAPVIAITALVSGHLLLSAAAALLTVYYLALIVPRAISDPVPAWAATAPRFRLAVANVYVDNSTPEDAAAQLVRSDADIIVIAEATPTFMDVFDRVGGDKSHPHRVLDPDDASDYAVAIASRLPVCDGSGMREIGPLTLAVAKVDIEGVLTTVAALNPQATFDTGGHETWKRQIAALKSFIPEVDGPLVVAGDLNTTRFRPEFQELLDTGLTDLIDALGQAWRPSFSLRSLVPIGAIGLIARLDHAIANGGVRALDVRNLKARGSDHLPFVITLAVRNPDDSGTAPQSPAERRTPPAPRC